MFDAEYDKDEVRDSRLECRFVPGTVELQFLTTGSLHIVVK